jgi:ribosomal protein S18 acetylase RimI-like enzyme
MGHCMRVCRPCRGHESHCNSGCASRHCVCAIAVYSFVCTLCNTPFPPVRHLLSHLCTLVHTSQVKGKPLSAATIRTGPDYIEVPFVATHESKRGRGFGRCVVEAIEDVARALNIPRLLLCSTCEASVSNTWKHLGFYETTEQQLAGWSVEDSDLVHMQNTLQVGGCGGGALFT